jgi:hypothetical protein
MGYFDDLEHTAALSELIDTWVRGWARRYVSRRNLQWRNRQNRAMRVRSPRTRRPTTVECFGDPRSLEGRHRSAQ